MTTYTDADVDRLVTAAQNLVNNESSWQRVSHKYEGWAALVEINEALRPFQPDPEAELVEEMARAYCEGYYGAGGGELHFALEKARLAGIRAALAVVRKQGVPE